MCVSKVTAMLLSELATPLNTSAFACRSALLPFMTWMPCQAGNADQCIYQLGWSHGLTGNNLGVILPPSPQGPEEWTRREWLEKMPGARLELARCRQRWILSPLRLPIPPSRQAVGLRRILPDRRTSWQGSLCGLPDHNRRVERTAFPSRSLCPSFPTYTKIAALASQ